MTDKAVSALTSLTGANTATGDLLYIVDISEAAAADRSKKITIAEAFKGVPAGAEATPSLAAQGDQDTGMWFPAANTLAWSTGGSESARITSGGNLLVGTQSSYTSASERLGVDGTQSNGGAGVAYIRNSLTTGADSSPCLVLYKAMTTTSSSARFVQFYADNNATPMGGIVGNGASNVQFATISDVREKTNIQPVSGSLDKVVSLRPVSFDWIKSGERVNAGFIAQEVEQVFPEFVVENMANEGEEARKGLTGGMTGGIIAYLVAAIKEQQAMINELKAEVAALKGA